MHRITNFLIASVTLFAAGFSGTLQAQTWHLVDVGIAASDGNTTNPSPTSFSLEGVGEGVGGAADSFHFAHQDVSGNVEIMAKLASFTNAAATGQAGLMIRKNLNEDSPFVMVAVSEGNGLEVRYRTIDGGSASVILGPLGAAPVWLRLMRSGTKFGGYYSADGLNWILVGAVDFDMGSIAHQGLVLSSGDAMTVAIASFDSVSAMHSVPQRDSNLRLWLRSDVGITKDGTGLVSQWDDQSGHANHALQGNAGNQPQFVPDQCNGKPALRFTAATDDFFTVTNHSTLNPAEVSMFVVSKRETGSAAVAGIVSKNAGASPSGYLLGYNGLDNGVAKNLRGLTKGVITQETVTAGSYDVLANVYSGLAMNLYWNGQWLHSAAFTSPLTPGSQNLLIGRQSAATNDFNGDILEVLIYGGEIKPDQLAEINAYFHSKYGIGQQSSSQMPGFNDNAAADNGVVILSAPIEVSLTVPHGHRLFYQINGGAITQYNSQFTVSENTVLSLTSERPGYAPVSTTRHYFIETASGYVPKAGLRLWLRADMDAGPGSESVWPDLSGEGNDAKDGIPPSAGEETINGKATKFFSNAAKNYLQIVPKAGSVDSLNIQNMTLVTVLRRSGTASPVRIVDKFAAGTGYSLRLDTDKVNGYINDSVAVAGDLTANVAQMVIQTYDGSQNAISVYGSNIPAAKTTLGGPGGPILSNTAPLHIGGVGQTLNFNGDIAEVLVYDSVLTPDQQSDLEAYMFERYGLGVKPVAKIGSSVSTGIYAEPQTVTLTSNFGATIYYTTNEFDPPSAFLEYKQQPLHIADTKIIRAFAVKAKFTNSAILEETITIEPDSNYVSRNGLVLWLRADVGVSTSVNATPASQWNDQSGHRHHAIQDDPNNPNRRPIYYTSQLNGRPGLRFSRSNQTHFAVNDHEAFRKLQTSVFAVYRRTDGNTPAVIVEKFTANTKGHSLQMSTAVDAMTYFGSTTRTGSFGANFGLVAQVYDGTNHNLWINGSAMPLTPGMVLDTPASPLYIGARGTAVNTGLDGEIAEILIYDRPVEEGERKDIEAYAWRRYLVGQPPQLDPPIPTAESVESGTYGVAQTVRFKPGSVTGTKIFYTLNGDTPTTASLEYDSYPGIQLSSNGLHRIQAIATKESFASSPVTELFITIDSSAAFLPRREDLVLWLRTDIGVRTPLDSGNVYRWEDQSGYGNHALQTVSNRQPIVAGAVINNKPAIKFKSAANGETFLAVADHISLTPDTISVFTVFNRTLNAGGAVVMEKYDTLTNSGYALRMAEGTTARSFINGDLLTAPIGTLGTFCLASQTYNSAGHSLRINGTAASSAYGAPYGVPFGAPGKQLYIGGRAATLPFDGHVAEVLLYRRALSDAERFEVEAYLLQKYGVGPPLQVAAPTFSLSSGVYTTNQTLTISPPAGGATIYYTDDGSEPTVSSLVYEEAPIAVTATKIIRAIAVKNGFVNSVESSAAIIIDAYKSYVPAGLKLWLRADSVVGSTGSAISHWDDMSGFQNDATQFNASYKPVLRTGENRLDHVAGALNDHPVVQFGSVTGTHLEIPDAASLDLTQGSMFAVVTRTGGTGNVVIGEKFVPSTSGYSLRHSAGNATWQVANTSTNTATRPMPLGTAPFDNNDYHLIGGVHGGGSNSIFVDGTATANTYNPAILANNNKLYIGGRAATSTTTLVGNVAAVWLFDHPLTDAERQSLEAYVNIKYGVGINPQLPVVTANPQGGTFNTAVYVSLGSSAQGATIRYTLAQGSVPPDPTDQSASYSDPVAIAISGVGINVWTLKARAFKPGHVSSNVQTWTYTMDPTVNMTMDGLVLWLRADTGVGLSGATDKIEEWRDQSGLGNHAMQTIADRKPSLVGSVLNGRPVVRFTSSTSNYLQVADHPSLNPATISLFTVFKRTSGIVTSLVLEKYGVALSRGYHLRMGATASLVRSYFGTNLRDGNLAENTFGVASQMYDEVKHKLFVNGTATTPLNFATPLNTPSDPLYIGGRTTTYSLNGDIAEVLIYDRALSDSERRQVDAYLMQRHNLAAVVLAAPIFSMPGGTLAAPSQVAVTAVTGAAIYYTTNGSTPTASSMLYSAPLWISYSQTVKAVAIKAGFPTSSISTVTYTLDPATYPAPVNNPLDTTAPTIELQKPTDAVLQ